MTLEQVWEDMCTDVSSVAYDEVCEDVTSEECVTTQQWICEDQDLGLQYRAPKVNITGITRKLILNVTLY